MTIEYCNLSKYGTGIRNDKFLNISRGNRRRVDKIYIQTVQYVLRLIDVLWSGSGGERLCAALAGLHPGDDGGGESRQLPVQRRRGPRSHPHLRQVGPQSRQSAKLFLQSSELGLPQPLNRRRVFPPPPPRFWGGGTLAGQRGAGTYTVVLFIYTYFVVWPSTQKIHCFSADPEPAF